jgi:Protein of unknown function (DUF4239)
MNPLFLAAIIGAVVLVSGILGLVLQRVLPDSCTTGGARDMIGAVAGLLTLLSALVLGLLIWTAYGVYSGQSLAVQSLAGKVLQLDMALADYGPDAGPLRAKVTASLVQTIDELHAAEQSDAVFVAANLEAALRGLESRDRAMKALNPQTDEQRQALANARSIVESIAQARLQMALALSSPVSYPLLLIVAGWVSVIFLGYGLTAKGHPMTVIVAFFGAFAAGTAFFLILDLSSPYDGVFHVSSAPLKQVLSVMGKDPAKD